MYQLCPSLKLYRCHTACHSSVPGFTQVQNWDEKLLCKYCLTHLLNSTLEFSKVYKDINMYMVFVKRFPFLIHSRTHLILRFSMKASWQLDQPQVCQNPHPTTRVSQQQTLWSQASNFALAGVAHRTGLGCRRRRSFVCCPESQEGRPELSHYEDHHNFQFVEQRPSMKRAAQARVAFLSGGWCKPDAAKGAWTVRHPQTTKKEELKSNQFKSHRFFLQNKLFLVDFFFQFKDFEV